MFLLLVAFALWASLVAQMVKNPSVMWETWVQSLGWKNPLEKGTLQIPWSGYPLQYSGLENPMDRGDWQATVYRVTQSWTWLKRLSTQHSETLAHYISTPIGDNFIPFSALKTRTPLCPFFLLADDLASCFTSKLKASRNEHWQVLHHHYPYICTVI